MSWLSFVEKLANRVDVDATPSSRFYWNKKAAGASGSYKPTPRRAPLLLCFAELFNSASWLLINDERSTNAQMMNERFDAFGHSDFVIPSTFVVRQPAFRAATSILIS